MKTVFALSVLLLIACTKADKDEIATNEQKKNNDIPVNQATQSPQSYIRPFELTQLDPEKIECIPVAYSPSKYPTTFSSQTFSEITYVYNSLSPGTKSMDTLTFGTPVNVLAEFQDHFMICTPSARAGYVRKTDISRYNSLGKGGYSYYLIGLSKYGTTDPSRCDYSHLKIVKASANNKIAEVYTDSIYGIEYQVNHLYTTALKDVSALLYINYNCYSEIGVSVDHFIVDNGKLSHLIVTESSGDGGSSDVTKVYLPTRLTNGKKIVLARNGILSVDDTNAKVQIYEYPENSGVPIEELIVVEVTTEEMGWDEEKGEPSYNEDGTQALYVEILHTIFYRWNGSTLQKVKTISKKTN